MAYELWRMERSKETEAGVIGSISILIDHICESYLCA